MGGSKEQLGAGGGEQQKLGDVVQGPAPPTVPQGPPVDLAVSASDDFIRNPNASARLIADVDEWVDSHRIELRRGEPLLIEPGSYRAIGGRVLVKEFRPEGVVFRTRSSGNDWHTNWHASVETDSETTVRLLYGGDLGSLLGLFQTARYLREQTRRLIPDIARHHHVWLRADRESKHFDISMAAHLLASSIAGQFNEAVIVVEILEEWQTRITRHIRDRCERYLEAIHDPPTEAKILGHIGEAAENEATFHHFLYVNVAEPHRIHEVLPVPPFKGFDRVVSIESKLEPCKVRTLQAHLKSGARNEQDPASPRFISFVPTFINCDMTKRGQGRAKTLRDMRPGGFDRMTPWPNDRPPAWRLLRDACWIDVDATALAGLWSEWKEEPGRKFLIREVAAISEPTRAAIDQWARAVTNRQVGLALSGGGASSYRFVPALRQFAAPRQGPDQVKREALPVDVVSGVSGGALIGAYYCALGAKEGCDKAIAHGIEMQFCLPFFAAWSQTLEWILDIRLGRRSIATLPTRFVPVAVCLMKGEPPETRILLDKSIGSAVRASGSLPIAFGPSNIGGEYYADGGFGSMIPTQAVVLHGADLVIAVNCIAGPSLGLPYESQLMFLRRWTLAGRLVDLWISLGYLQQEASRLAVRTGSAPFLIEPAKSEGPFIEMVRFYDAKGIAERAAEDGSFNEGIRAAVDQWEMFRDFGAEVRFTRRSDADERGGKARKAAAPEPDVRDEAAREGAAPEHAVDDQAARDGRAPDTSARALRAAFQPAGQPAREEDTPMPQAPLEPSEISKLLPPDKLELLRESFSDPESDIMLREETPKLYGPAAAYFGAIVDTYYVPDASRVDTNGQRVTLDPEDRQRVVIALQAATGQESPLAIHIYIGLMVGLTIDEIANILLLAGVYAGVPNFFTGLGTLATTLQVLVKVVDAGDCSCKAVLDAIRKTWRQPIPEV